MKLYDTLSPQFAQAGINRLDIEDLLCVSFIIIDDMYKASVPQNIQHRRGPNSPFADSEVLAISWVGELMSVDSEKAWYSFVKKQCSHLFPHLPERSRFNRRRRNLWKVTDFLRQQFLLELPVGDIFLVDSLPVPLCDFKRAYFSKSPLKTEGPNGLRATYGHCATKGLGTFLGFRIHLLMSLGGVPLCFVVANADIDDREVLPQMIECFVNTIVIGDKGYVSEPLHHHLFEAYGVDLLAQKRSNQKNPYPPQIKQTINRLRKRVDVTIGQLEDQFHLAKVRARTHWGLLTRMSDKVAAFTLGALLNVCLGRPLLALKDLAFA